MAFSFVGNTSVSVTSAGGNLPTVIDSFSVVNKEAATIYVNVYKVRGVNVYNISPASLALDAGEMYEGTRAIVLLATEQIRVHPSGSVDYDFTISNMNI